MASRWSSFLSILGIAVVLGGIGLYATRGWGDNGKLPAPGEALPGRATPTPLTTTHVIFKTPLDITPPGTEVAYFAMGCFWSAEQHFFHLAGVVSTAVGYAGGITPNPTYDEVSSGRTGHAEVVRVVYDPAKISYAALLAVFWEQHDPTQGMRQGNDTGTDYRSMILTTSDAQRAAAIASQATYAAALRAAGRGEITTEIAPERAFYFADSEHQQYCERNPTGYCGHGGTGVRFPTGGPDLLR